jgi:cysteine desulfurase/selenocysteine lyase
VTPGTVASVTAALPDPGVIARLASDFFAALPGALGVTGVTAAAEPPAALPLQAGSSPDVPNLFSTPGSALPMDLLEALRIPPQDPATATVASPSGPSFYFLELARLAPAEQAGASSAAPSVPPVTEYTPAPGADLPAVPNNPVGATGLPSQAGANLPGAGPAGSSFYFLNGEAPAPPHPVPLSLPVSEEFTFPGLPGLQTFPESSSLNASPVTEPETRKAPDSLDLTRSAAAEEAIVSPGAPSLPSATESTPAPGGVLPAAPGSPAVAAGLPSQAGASIPEAAPSESSFYFLNAEITKTPNSVPASLPAREQFSFPGLPGLQSLPGNSGLPASPPTAADGRALPSSLLGASAVLSAIPKVDAQPSGLPYFVDPEKSATKAASPSVDDNLFKFSPAMLPELGLTPGLFDPRSIRRDFPILQERIHGRQLVWLDNGATTQKPNAVIDRLSSYYRHENSNVHRAAHTLAARSTDAYEGAREKVRRFLSASSTREIAFVRGTTEGINLVAKSWGYRNVEKDDEVVITWLEHHANIVPWQQLCEARGARLRVAPVDDRGQVKLDEYEKLLNPRTRIVAFSHVSNALGTITPARQMVEMAHRHGARVLIDGAQSVAHMREDVQALDCDFFVFSGHKIFAPTGIGVVYARGDLFDTTPPWQGGGNMILDVTFEKTTYNVAPARFEAGTGSIADAVGLGAALDYLSQVGIENVTRYEHELLNYATAGLSTVPGLHIIGTAQEKAGVLSFVLDGFRTEDVGKALDEEGIAVRAGHHCAQPILRRFGVESTVRATLAMYNTCEDIDALVAALRRIQAGRGLSPQPDRVPDQERPLR